MDEHFFFSPSTCGFYLETVHGADMPADVVAIAADDHSALMAAQAAGCTIASDPDGYPIAVPRPAPTVAELTARGAAVVQGHLDATARQRRYDSIQTAVSYRDDPNPVFAAEGEALFAWRSAVWTAALAILADVEAGEMPIPSDAALIAALPEMVWPEA